MTTAVINDTDLDELDLDWLLADDAWFWYGDLPTWLSLEAAAELMNLPLAEVEARHALLTGDDND